MACIQTMQHIKHYRTNYKWYFGKLEREKPMPDHIIHRLSKANRFKIHKEITLNLEKTSV